MTERRVPGRGPFARILNGRSLRGPLKLLPSAVKAVENGVRVPLACLRGTWGLSSVWLAFVGGVRHTLRIRGSSATTLLVTGFRPRFVRLLRRLSRLVAGTVGGAVCWRLRVFPSAACLPLFSCLFFCLASAGCAVPRLAAILRFPCAVPMISGSAHVVYITTDVAVVKCLNPDLKDFKDLRMVGLGCAPFVRWAFPPLAGKPARPGHPLRVGRFETCPYRVPSGYSPARV